MTDIDFEQKEPENPFIKSFRALFYPEYIRFADVFSHCNGAPLQRYQIVYFLRVRTSE